MIEVAPSILACDFARLGEEAAAIRQAGGTILHVDVMDGQFVPNISLGIPVVASLRKATDLFLDVHLMIADPGRYLNDFAAAGSDGLTVHLECRNTAPLLIHIREKGLRAGVSLSPETPVDALLPLLPLCDLVLVMTVRPGFGGQSFMPEMMEKLDAITAHCKKEGLSPILEVDGGISPATAPTAAAHGATLLVAGSAVFGKPDYRVAMEAIKTACRP